MASGAVKMRCLAAALAALLFTAVNAEVNEITDWVLAGDMVPAGGLMVMVPAGDVASLVKAPPTCLQCRCCSKSEPNKCEMNMCCSTFNCDPNGRCNVAQKDCGCSSC